ncbi:MAG: NPCBM/NEW2 domain-containing protein [Myxococcales bacterium]|nr:NPCBM/NEW2 domain-containing protein [Myxococcales bacterium]
MGAALPGSLVRYNGGYGAMLVDASATAVSFQFITTSGAVIDALTLTKAATTYSLNVTAVNGAVARSPNQPAYAAGAAVTLTAAPSAGYQFIGWSGDATGTTNPLTVTMTASKTITANFAAIGASRYVSDLAWVPVANAWGPVEKDRSNGGQLAGDGRVLTINGATYAKGLGVTARAEVTVPLGGAYRTFTSDVGIDDEVGLTGSAVFVVVVDGVERYRSATLTGASAKVAVAVDITGAQTLRADRRADGRRRLQRLRRLGRRDGDRQRHAAARSTLRERPGVGAGGQRVGPGGEGPQQRRAAGGRRAGADDQRRDVREGARRHGAGGGDGAAGWGVPDVHERRRDR